MSRLFGIIPAAGTGARFGGGLPKQYASLAGAPILAHAIRSITEGTPVARAYVVIAPADTHYARHVGERARVSVLRCGGATRAESVRNGLALLMGEVREDDWVLVHDAARPCLPHASLTRLLVALAEDPVGGLLAMPVADTLKRADADGRVAATEPREGLWRAQTPQMFRFGVLRRALAAPGAGDATDEAQAVERLGLRPRLVEGSALNVKVTYESDLALAACALVLARPR